MPEVKMGKPQAEKVLRIGVVTAMVITFIATYFYLGVWWYFIPTRSPDLPTVVVQQIDALPTKETDYVRPPSLVRFKPQHDDLKVLHFSIGSPTCACSDPPNTLPHDQTCKSKYCTGEFDMKLRVKNDRVNARGEMHVECIYTDIEQKHSNGYLLRHQEYFIPTGRKYTEHTFKVDIPFYIYRDYISVNSIIGADCSVVSPESPMVDAVVKVPKVVEKTRR